MRRRDRNSQITPICKHTPRPFRKNTGDETQANTPGDVAPGVPARWGGPGRAAAPSLQYDNRSEKVVARKTTGSHTVSRQQLVRDQDQTIKPKIPYHGSSFTRFAILSGRVASGAIALRPARDARLDMMAKGVVAQHRFKVVVLGQRLGSGQSLKLCSNGRSRAPSRSASKSSASADTSSIPSTRPISGASARARHQRLMSSASRPRLSPSTPAPRDGQFVLHAKALPRNPYDGHTRGDVIETTKQLTGCPIERA